MTPRSRAQAGRSRYGAALVTLLGLTAAEAPAAAAPVAPAVAAEPASAAGNRVARTGVAQGAARLALAGGRLLVAGSSAGSWTLHDAGTGAVLARGLHPGLAALAHALDGTLVTLGAGQLCQLAPAADVASCRKEVLGTEPRAFAGPQRQLWLCAGQGLLSPLALADAAAASTSTALVLAAPCHLVAPGVPMVAARADGDLVRVDAAGEESLLTLADPVLLLAPGAPGRVWAAVRGDNGDAVLELVVTGKAERPVKIRRRFAAPRRGARLHNLAADGDLAAAIWVTLDKGGGERRWVDMLGAPRRTVELPWQARVTARVDVAVSRRPALVAAAEAGRVAVWSSKQDRLRWQSPPP